MRPDQHKKKRSAQYKKKHGIQKDEQSKEKGKRERREEKDKLGAPNSTAVTDTKKLDQNKTDKEEKEFTPSFSRRQIDSNWARYEGLPDENEEETITARGVEFNRLLSETGHAEAQFRFKDEQSWEEDGMQTHEAGAKFLSVDMDALAHHIRAIPIPERLGISRSLFEDELLEKLDKAAKDESNKTTSTLNGGDRLHIPSHDDTFSAIDRATDVELVSNERTQKLEAKTRHEELNLTSGLRASELNSNREHLKESIKSSAQTLVKGGFETNAIATDTRTTVEPSSGVVSTDDDNEGDDELNFLLSLENPVQVKGQSVASEAKGGGGEDHNLMADSDTQSSKPLEAQETHQASGLDTACHQADSSLGKTGTDDLEDWLDDMLDD